MARPFDRPFRVFYSTCSLAARAVTLGGIALATYVVSAAEPASQPAALVPLPAKVEWKEGQYTLGRVIQADAASQKEARQLAEMLRPATGIDFQVVRSNDVAASGRAVSLREDTALAATSPEAYRLSVTPTGVTITGASPAGVFYGMQTLRQLLPPQIFATSRQSDVKWTIPCVEIEDQPRFAWRGMMLDVSRHFHNADSVKRQLDLMAMHKLNIFHWHLADDQGFRIEIKSYPKLTAVGGQVEKGADNYAQGETIAPHVGYFTQEQVRDIVAYAAARHINIVPEIDIPGHSGAAATAYPEILCHDEQGHALSGNVWCASREANYRMLDAIVGELVQLFPFTYVHVGGDEVNQSIWPRCPHCHALMQEKKMTSAGQLQGYFIRRYEEILRKHGRKMIGWNEILGDGLSKDSAIVSWQNDSFGYAAAVRGIDAVFAPGSFCYLDMKESPQDGWGMMWAGAVSLAKMYSFDPLARPGLSEAQRAHILGVQACLWSEYVGSQERADYKIWPRMCSLAEVGWTPQPRRNLNEFLNRLGPAHLERLSLQHVNYRVPEAELAAAGTGSVQIVPPFAGAEVRYTLDGSQPTRTSPRWTGEPLATADAVKVSAAVFAPDGRASRTVSQSFGHPIQATAESSMPAYQENTPARLLDGDPATFFWSNGNGKAGDAVTITFAKPRSLSLVEVDSGKPGTTSGDIVVAGSLLASPDGTHYHAIAKFKDGRAVARLHKETIRSLRVRLDADHQTWIVVQDPILK